MLDNYLNVKTQKFPELHGGKGNGNPLQCSCLENLMDGGAWEATVHGVAKSQTLEKAMAPHSSTLAWKISWMEEPGGLQSMGSLRVGHD